MMHQSSISMTWSNPSLSVLQFCQEKLIHQLETNDYNAKATTKGIFQLGAFAGGLKHFFSRIVFGQSLGDVLGVLKDLGT